MKIMQKRNKKKLIVNVCITLATFALAAFYLTRSNIVTAEALKKVGFGDCFLVLCFFLFSLLLYAATDFFVYRTVSDKMPYRKCVMNTLAGNLGSNVTPLKSGHFPIMAYYKCITGIGAEESVTGLIKCQIIYSTTSTAVYFVLAVTLLCTGTSFTVEETTIKTWVVIAIGFSFHAVVLGAILLLSFNKRLQEFCLKIRSKILYKFKKIQDREEYTRQKAEWFARYRKETLAIYESFYRYIPAVLCYGAFMLAFGSVQYFSYLVFSGEAFSFDKAFVFYTLNVAAAYITNVIPVPGGVGTAEVTFSLVYSFVLDNPALGSVLVLWRAGSYYLPTLLEAVVVPFALFAKRKSVGAVSTENSQNDKSEPHGLK